MMKRLLMSAAIAALAVPAIAQDTTTPETAADEAVQATEEAAGTAAEAAGDAADAAADADAAVEAGAAEGEAMEAEAAADSAATEEVVTEEVVEEPVVAPTEAQPELDPATPSMLASWVEGLQVYTTNQPSSSEWSALEGETVPEEWDSIADIGDIVIDGNHQVVGYVVDIGGFLGIGAKEVLISTEAMKMATFGKDVIFATNYTREELGALPDFDDSMMLPATLAPAAPADPAAAPADPAAAPAEGEAAPAEGEAAPASN